MNVAIFLSAAEEFAKIRSECEVNTSIILFEIIGLATLSYTVQAEYEIPSDNCAIQYVRIALYRNGIRIWQRS